MAEQVNQRIENVVNELEQMQRTNLYTPEEIREISRKIKELEYKLQRRTKHKEDFTEYISYNLVLLEDISLRRKQIHLLEKRQDIEYSIAKRLNKVFKQFIYRFQNDIEVYFQYIKFCRGVKFDHAISGIITQMLQIYGDKPKMWQLAAKWEYEANNNLENGKKFLLQGIQRHPESEILYLELLFLELTGAFKADNEEEKQKLLTRADIVWKSAIKKIQNVNFHSKICSLVSKFECAENLKADCCEEFWTRHCNEKEAWVYVANDVINNNVWIQLNDVICVQERNYPDKICQFVSIYEAAVLKFSDESLATSYIHFLLKLTEEDCSNLDKITLIMNALRYCHDQGLLAEELYDLWIDMLIADGDYSSDEITEILEEACAKKPTARILYEKLILLNKNNDEKMLAIVQKAKLKTEDMTYLWNFLLDNLSEKATLHKLYEKCKQCDSVELIKLKPKFLQLCYDLKGIQQSIVLYNELIKTPPIQMEVHDKMIEILKKQEPVDVKTLRKVFDCATRNFGSDMPDIWLRYVDFEYKYGGAKFVPALYQRALGMLKKEIVDEFIKGYMMKKSGPIVVK